jgi:hypothetical protein
VFSSIGVAVACGILEYGITEPGYGKEIPELGTRMSKYGSDLKDILLDRYRERLVNEEIQRKAFPI